VWGGALLLALALWFAADTSRMPVVLRVFAVVSLGAGLAGPVVGTSPVHMWMARVAARPDGYVREWAVVGGFLLWAVFPNVTANRFLSWSDLRHEETGLRSARHGLPASGAMNRHDRLVSHHGRACSWTS